jgi:hypothetical protein
MDAHLAIDFGNDASRFALSLDGSITLLTDAAGESHIPTAVAFPPGTSRLFGQVAAIQQSEYREHTVTKLKDHIDSYCLDRSHPLPGVTVHQCIAFFIHELFQIAASRARPSKLIVAISPAWSPAHRQVLLDSVRLLDLGIPVEFVHSTTAATFQYWSRFAEVLPPAPDRRWIVVSDFGDSAAAVSVVGLWKQGFEVAEHACDCGLGGRHFTDALRLHLTRENAQLQNLDEDAKLRVLEAVTDIKRGLSTASQTVLEIPWIRETESVKMPVTRQDFEAAVGSLVARVKPLFGRAPLAGAPAEVIRLGLGLCIPAIEKQVRDFFGMATLKNVLNRREASVLGALISVGFQGVCSDRWAFSFFLKPGAPTGDKRSPLFGENWEIPIHGPFSLYCKDQPDGPEICLLKAPAGGEYEKLRVSFLVSGLVEVWAFSRAGAPVQIPLDVALSDEEIKSLGNEERKRQAEDRTELEIDSLRSTCEESIGLIRGAQPTPEIADRLQGFTQRFEELKTERGALEKWRNLSDSLRQLWEEMRAEKAAAASQHQPPADPPVDGERGGSALPGGDPPALTGEDPPALPGEDPPALPGGNSPVPEFDAPGN